MINKIEIQNFKALLNEKINFAPLTVLTGINSSGKSTLLQAIMLLETSGPEPLSYTSRLKKCLLTGLSTSARADSAIVISGNYAKNIKMAIRCQNSNIKWQIESENVPGVTYCVDADRVGPRDSYETNYANVPKNDFGDHCKWAWHVFNTKKNKVPYKKLIHSKASTGTLSGQVNFWLNHIVGTEISTAGSATDEIKAKYKSLASDNDYITATQTGFGTSTLFPVILAPLLAQKGDRVIIENPEIHLHPQAQANLADLFVFAANAGVQIIVETHCEHLIYSLCSRVHRHDLDAGKLMFYYKGGANEAFQCIKVNPQGRFITEDDELTGFPHGFFDATTSEYLAIYR